MTPRLYAHRGAAAELPENTVPAFLRALEVGADAIETDAHMTRDGHVVLSHDPSGQRMAGIAREIRAATLTEVRSWDVGRGFVDAQGGRPFEGGGYRIPTLAEALAACPHVPFNVDAKQGSPDMLPALLDVIRKANAEDRVLVASFDARLLGRVRRLGYRGETGLGRADVLRVVCSPVAVLRRFPIRGAAIQIPTRVGAVRLATRPFINKCHALGLKVHFWTINEPAEAERLLALGADGIMTDDPTRLAPLFTMLRQRHAGE
jgi:glycerophosphoryl diester phosphodiesterase